jgi:hypothetical protein
MKNARPSKEDASVPGQGADIIAVGRYPAKCDTVTAEVLARLLAHEKLTSLDGVREASTTRLSAVVHYLQSEYGWPIEATDKAAGCRDGRISWVAEYGLPHASIAAAMVAGAGVWCGRVRRCRTARRANAANARRQAARMNTARARARLQSHPAQAGLFESSGAPT